MALVRKNLSSWIIAAIILVVGILCIVAGAAFKSGNIEDGSNALKAINLTLGIILIIVGSLSLLLAVIAGILAKKSFAAIAFPGAAIVAIGASLCAEQYATTLMGILITVVPFLFIALGIVVLADGIFILIRGISSKQLKGVLVPVIVLLAFAVLAIVLGFLCINFHKEGTPVIDQNVQLIIFGIVVCLVALFKFLVTFIKLPAAVAFVSVENKEEK